MGRFKAKEQAIREFPWGTIAFLDSHRIEMRYSLYVVQFHRFGAPKGDYGASWSPFRRRLWKYATLTPEKVFKLANQFEVQHLTRIKEDYGRTIH